MKQQLQDEKNLLHSNIFQIFLKKKNTENYIKTIKQDNNLRNQEFKKKLDHLTLLMSSLI